MPRKANCTKKALSTLKKKRKVTWKRKAGEKYKLKKGQMLTKK